MAQNNWINLTVDPSAAKKPDNSDHRHAVTAAASASGDFTLSFDSAKFTSMSLLRSAVNAALAIAAGSLPK